MRVIFMWIKNIIIILYKVNKINNYFFHFWTFNLNSIPSFNFPFSPITATLANIEHGLSGKLILNLRSAF